MHKKNSMTTTKENHLTLKHYKEPLKKVPQGAGYGYYGAILGSLDGEHIQCHVCGKLFASVSAHARQKHKITITEYREIYQLSRTTVLVSESERIRMKKRTMEWLNSMSPKQKKEMFAKALRGSLKWRREHPELVGLPWKNRKEYYNKNGTCPDQLIAKIHEVKDRLGRTPSLAEFIHETGGQRYKHLIFTTFGSWLNALKVAKLKPKEWHPKAVKPRFTDEELLEYLSLYAQENGQIPTATDSKRGLIPDYAIYSRRFGSFERARKMAGVYNFVQK